MDASALTLAELRATRDAFVAAADWHNAAPPALAIVQEPDCPATDLRVASGILTQCDRMRDALPIASRASAVAPDNAEYAQHAGCISNQCGDHAGAIGHLLRAKALDGNNAETYQQLALASERLGDLAAATALAREACRLEPVNLHRGLVLAHLLARQNAFVEAIDLTRRLLERAAEPDLWRFLAHLLERMGDHSGALAAIERAGAADPASADYHGIRAILLLELGRLEEADAALRRARELDPANLGHMRHAVSVLLGRNDIAGALAYAGRLLAIAPDNVEFANCMRHILDHQAMSTATSDFAGIALLKAQGPPRTRSGKPSFRQRSANQWRIIVALVLREVRSRYSESHLGFLWVLMEPIVHVGVLAIVFQFTIQGRPPMGDSFFLFYFTGVMPYLLLNHLAIRVGSAVRDSRSLMSIASIVPLDLLVSKSLVEVFVTAVVFLIFTGFFPIFGVDGSPWAPEFVFSAFAITYVLGTGIGLITAALSRFGMVVETVLSVLLRLLYFTSGIFYVPGNLPLFAREILVWNPFLHVVDLMRTGYFRGYQPPWQDVSYALEFSLVVLLCGLAAIAATSRRLRILG